MLTRIIGRITPLLSYSFSHQNGHTDPPIQPIKSLRYKLPHKSSRKLPLLIGNMKLLKIKVNSFHISRSWWLKMRCPVTFEQFKSFLQLKHQNSIRLEMIRIQKNLNKQIDQEKRVEGQQENVSSSSDKIDEQQESLASLQKKMIDMSKEVNESAKRENDEKQKEKWWSYYESAKKERSEWSRYEEAEKLKYRRKETTPKIQIQFQKWSQMLNNLSLTHRLIFMTLFGFLITFVFKMLKLYRSEMFLNQFFAKNVDLDQFLTALRNDNISETWVKTIQMEMNDLHSKEKTNTVGFYRDRSGKTFKCVGNEQFKKYWKKAVEEYNFEKGSVDPSKFVVMRFPETRVKSSVLSKIEGAMGLLVLFLVFKHVSSQSKQFKGMKGKLNPNDETKSYLLTNTLNVRFKDVVGMQKAKEQIVEFIDFLTAPQKYHRLGARIPKGALLTGPPGTGKTMIAKACAGQSNVPFFCISGSEFIEMYVGVGAKRVRDLFAEAKAKAPSIIFIDQIDAVGKKRSNLGGNDEKDSTLNQLLVEMDGFNSNSNVIVFAATNQKDVLDPALTRPGRFDRVIEVDLPDLEGRKQIFQVHLKPIKIDKTLPLEEYARRMATLTPGFSGAEIKNICNEAALIAARNQTDFVYMNDFQMATERIIGGVEKKSSLITPETRRTVAYHECGHGVVSWFIQHSNPLLKLTIIPRSKGALGFAQYLPSEHQMQTLKSLQDQICVILGGRMAEEVFFNKVSTGAADDLNKAYSIVKSIVTQYGFGQGLGWLSYTESEYAKDYSHQTEDKIDEEIFRIIAKCTKRTKEIVEEKRDLIEKLALLLLEKQTVDQVMIEQVLGPRPFKLSKQHQSYVDEKRKMMEQSKKGDKKKDNVAPSTPEAAH